MTHKNIDRCKETTSTTGTGTLTLAGAVPGFVTVANATNGLTADGDTGWFEAINGTEWEIFLGTRVDATHLARTTVISSSSAGVAVSFTSPPVVFSTVPGAKLSAAGGPAFGAYRATSAQSFASATSTKVAFNAEEFDTASAFDSTTNNRFTAGVAGYYRFEWLTTVTGATLTNAVSFMRKNGTDIASGTSVPASTTQLQVGGAKLVYMAVGDYVEWFIFAGGTTLTIATGPDKSFATGSLVRPA